MDLHRRQQRTPAEASRDEGLRRVSTLTKWVAVGAVASVGALAGFVAQAKPGHSTTNTQSRGGGAATTPSPRASSSGTANQGDDGSVGSSSSSQPAPTLSPPATAPAPTPSPPTVVSGGS